MTHGILGRIRVSAAALALRGMGLSIVREGDLEHVERVATRRMKSLQDLSYFGSERIERVAVDRPRKRRFRDAIRHSCRLHGLIDPFD